MFIDDISHNKFATQSHTNTNNDASRAVDGITATCMQTSAIGVGTSFKYRTVWWKVDLGRVYSIYSINIQFRNYDGYGLCLFTIYVYVLILHFITLNLFLSGIKYIIMKFTNITLYCSDKPIQDSSVLIPKFTLF